MQPNNPSSEKINPYLRLFTSEDNKTRQTFIRKAITPNSISPDCLELILIKPYPEIPSDFKLSYKKETPSNLKVSLNGIGESTVDDRVLTFLKFLQDNNFNITDLILYDIELKRNAIYTILKILPNLTALELINVPLDNIEILALKEIQNESLTYLKLAYTDPDFTEDKTEIPPKESKYSFLANFAGLKYLHLIGLELVSIDFQLLNSIGKRIIHLGVENLKVFPNPLFDFIQTISKYFPDLEVLSLADNNLEKIDIPQFDFEFLPQSLKVLNLNNAGLTTAQLGLFMSRNRKIDPEEVYFKGNLLSDIKKSPAIFNLFTKNVKNVLDISSNPLKQEDVDIVTKNFNETLDVSFVKSSAKAKVTKEDIKTKEIQHLNVNLEVDDDLKKPELLNDILIENQRNLKKLENKFEEKKANESDFQTKGDRFDFSRATFKALRFTDQFFSRKQNSRPRYLTDYNSLLASSNLETMNADLPHGFVGEQPIPIHDTPLIRIMLPYAESLSRDEGASGTFREQMVYFREFMTKIGYPPLTREIEEEDCEEQLFRVFLPENTVSHDLRVVMFTVKWYKTFEQANLEFCLSDDWFQKRQERVNRVSIQNQDIVVTLLNHLNNHVKEFSFHLSSEAWDRTSDNVEDDEEIYFIDAGFKKNFLYLDKLNLVKEILTSIDLGFIILKMLLEEDLYDMDMHPENFDQWSMIFWKAAKNSIRKYKDSKEYKLISKKI